MTPNSVFSMGNNEDHERLNHTESMSWQLAAIVHTPFMRIYHLQTISSIFTDCVSVIGFVCWIADSVCCHRPLLCQMNITNPDNLNGCFRQTTWWRHKVETFSALLAICAGNLPVTDEFPTQRPVPRSFDVFFDLRLNYYIYLVSYI